ncbi:hypothetical protein HK102_012726, partial [Quaeritorhiza haematococci]
VYSGTYIVANATQSICDWNGWDWFYPKFVTTSIANVSFSVAKDLYFTRSFGKGNVSHSVPLRSYGLYTARDSLTIFASFNLPPMVSSKLNQYGGVPMPQAELAAQLITPCAIQLVSTPMHLLGMNLYNEPKATIAERAGFMRREYVKTTAARMGRIFPAYGVGGVANKWLTKNARELLNEFHAPSGAANDGRGVHQLKPAK